MSDAEDKQNQAIDSLRLQLDAIERGLDMEEADVRRLNERMDEVESKRP